MSSEKWQHVKQKHAISESQKQANEFSVLGERLPFIASSPGIVHDARRGARQAAAFSMTALAGRTMRFAATANHLRRKTRNR